MGAGPRGKGRGRAVPSSFGPDENGRSAQSGRGPDRAWGRRAERRSPVRGVGEVGAREGGRKGHPGLRLEPGGRSRRGRVGKGKGRRDTRPEAPTRALQFGSHRSRSDRPRPVVFSLQERGLMGDSQALDPARPTLNLRFMGDGRPR